MSFSRVATIASLLALASAPVMAQDALTPSLPGGASAVNEVHGDWTVSCTATAAARSCSLSQVRINPQIGQRVFGLELLA
jgi:invasion protein IalB